METVSIDGIPTSVREVSRPSGWPCRLLETADGGAYVLEYLVSIGPYKIDVCQYHWLTDRESEQYRRGALDLGARAAELAENAQTLAPSVHPSDATRRPPPADGLAPYRSIPASIEEMEERIAAAGVIGAFLDPEPLASDATRWMSVLRSTADPSDFWAEEWPYDRRPALYYPIETTDPVRWLAESAELGDTLRRPAPSGGAAAKDSP